MPRNFWYKASDTGVLKVIDTSRTVILDEFLGNIAARVLPKHIITSRVKFIITLTLGKLCLINTSYYSMFHLPVIS
jgi:hypothetical protein